MQVSVEVCGACASPGPYLSQHGACAVSDYHSHSKGELPLPVVDVPALLVITVVPWTKNEDNEHAFAFVKMLACSGICNCID